MSDAFVHLHLHSEYSLANGTVRIRPLVNSVADAGMPAVAITDQSNLFAMVKFYKAAMARGVKPIVGADIFIEQEDAQQVAGRVVLLCMNLEGYRNLTRLISKAYIEGQQRGKPQVKPAWLAQHSAGLIALSGGCEGDIGLAILQNKMELAHELTEFWQHTFPDRFYIELQRTGHGQEENYIGIAMTLAEKYDLPVVATNNVHFLTQQDFEAHEARVCIHEGRVLDDPRRPHDFTDQQYLRSAEEMCQIFADIPEAIVNTVEIAKRCNINVTLGENVLPDYPVPAGQTIADYLREVAEQGLIARLQKLFKENYDPNSDNCKPYFERLHTELDVIINMGFPGYFLIVADFIRWSKENGIPVGPGRGSGAGSLVAYALTITDLDPLEYDLLFERFLNPERVSMPDFDVDFCMEGRDRVIDYVAEKYGRDKVSQIITYGSMAAKAVVRDVGRVMGHPYGFVDRIAKLIPFEIGITLEKALDQEEALKALYDEDEDVQNLINMARSLEGVARNAGKHAGGVVIAPSALTDFTPLYCEQGGESLVTQFDKDDVEAVGLVKFDFLGLRTLTIIDWAIRGINKLDTTHQLDITEIPLDDSAAFDLLRACNTTAVFQLESRGMKDLIKRLQPDVFEDIIALVALFRPGPLQSGMVDDFIDRKHGRARVEYPHPELEPILKPTYGVILYQEQVMQIAQVLAGYSLGAADMLRRAMGKKKPEEMAKQRSIFLDGATKRGVAEKTATYIFDLMEKFAGYGFNKSHSAAYALLAYQTAWLKAHYPAAFMSAVLSADMDNTDKVVTLIDECNSMKLKVNPPNVNACQYQFSVANNTAIIYGLGAIKGVGEAAIENIIAARQHGSFESLFEFCERIDVKKVNRRTLEALIMAGAMDVFGENRATLMASLPAALHISEQQSFNNAVGQNDMFGISSVAVNESGLEYNTQKDWSEQQRLACEKQTLGLYLTGHPINRYLPELEQFISARIADLKPTKDKSIVVAGLIIAMRVMNTRRGDKMAFITIDDRSGRIEIAVFSEAFNKYRDMLIKDKLIVIEGDVAVDEYSGGYRMSTREVYDIEQARERYAKSLRLEVEQEKIDGNYISQLQSIMRPFKDGFCPVVIGYQQESAAADLTLGDNWRVTPSDELIHRLQELNGKNAVKVIYR